MRYSLVIMIIIGVLMISFSAGPAQDSDEILKSIRMYSYEELEPLLNKDNDTTYLINFWASWCTPCLEEMPAFENIRVKYKDRNFKLILVSLDFPDHLENRVVPAILQHNINGQVILLDDPDANKWINKIHPEWSGAIPATLVYNTSSREFYEKSFTYEELDAIIKLKMNIK